MMGKAGEKKEVKEARWSGACGGEISKLEHKVTIGGHGKNKKMTSEKLQNLTEQNGWEVEVEQGKDQSDWSGYVQVPLAVGTVRSVHVVSTLTLTLTLTFSFSFSFSSHQAFLCINIIAII